MQTKSIVSMVVAAAGTWATWNPGRASACGTNNASGTMQQCLPAPAVCMRDGGALWQMVTSCDLGCDDCPRPHTWAAAQSTAPSSLWPGLWGQIRTCGGQMIQGALQPVYMIYDIGGNLFDAGYILA